MLNIVAVARSQSFPKEQSKQAASNNVWSWKHATAWDIETASRIRPTCYRDS